MTFGGALSRRIFSLLVVALVVTGCSKSGEQQQVGDITLEVTTDPTPLQVGETAAITAILNRAGEPVNDCGIRFRQHMPEMEMSADSKYIVMKALGPEGAYAAQSSEFSMGGGWELEFVVECGPETHTLVFPYFLEWPE